MEELEAMADERSDDLQSQKERIEYLKELDKRFEDIRNGTPLIRKTMEELESMAGE